MENLGDRIRAVRKHLKMTQRTFGATLAERTGRVKPFAFSTVLSWEKGDAEPMLEVLFTMGKMAHISPAWIAFGSLVAPMPTFGGHDETADSYYARHVVASNPDAHGDVAREADHLAGVS